MALDPLPEISLSMFNFTCGHWFGDHREGEFIDLDAPYQRGEVWTLDQKQALIKSLLMKLPIGALVVSVLPTTQSFHYRVVDGKQRILALRGFVADEFAVPGWWFRPEYLKVPSWRSLDVLYSQTSELFHRHLEMTTPFPAMEFQAYAQWLGRDSKGESRWKKRTEAEAIQAEAEVYGLINFAGSPQTEEDRERAAKVAGGTN